MFNLDSYNDLSSSTSPRISARPQLQQIGKPGRIMEEPPQKVSRYPLPAVSKLLQGICSCLTSKVVCLGCYMRLALSLTHSDLQVSVPPVDEGFHYPKQKMMQSSKSTSQGAPAAASTEDSFFHPGA